MRKQELKLGTNIVHTKQKGLRLGVRPQEGAGDSTGKLDRQWISPTMLSLIGEYSPMIDRLCSPTRREDWRVGLTLAAGEGGRLKLDRRLCGAVVD